MYRCYYPHLSRDQCLPYARFVKYFRGVMETIYQKSALHSSKKECARNDIVLFSISHFSKRLVSFKEFFFAAKRVHIVSEFRSYLRKIKVMLQDNLDHHDSVCRLKRTLPSWRGDVNKLDLRYTEYEFIKD